MSRHAAVTPLENIATSSFEGTAVEAYSRFVIAFEESEAQDESLRGARCVSVPARERECPVDAITITLSNVETRNDIPAPKSDASTHVK